MEMIQVLDILVKREHEALRLKAIIQNGQDFRKYAKEFSIAPSAKNGGLLGQFKRGQMDKELEDIAFSLDVGEISEPIKTKDGYHLLCISAKQVVE